MGVYARRQNYLETGYCSVTNVSTTGPTEPRSAGATSRDDEVSGAGEKSMNTAAKPDLFCSPVQRGRTRPVRDFCSNCIHSSHFQIDHVPIDHVPSSDLLAGGAETSNLSPQAESVLSCPISRASGRSLWFCHTAQPFRYGGDMEVVGEFGKFRYVGPSAERDLAWLRNGRLATGRIVVAGHE